MFRRIRESYLEKKFNAIRDDIDEMLRIIDSDKSHKPSMMDIMNILTIHLIAKGHKQKYINKILTEHYQGLYDNVKRDLTTNIERMESDGKAE